MNNLLLKIWVSGQNGVSRLKDQQGAETIQVIMIMGIMAIIIAAVFLVDGGLKDKITTLGTTIGEKITNIGG
jgi:hypothetical protein